MAKTLCGAVLTLLLIIMVAVPFYIQPVEASETIYIQADGEVFPSTAPIQRNGDVYILTSDISDSIWVLRDNMVLDGASYTLQGTTSIEQGIRLAGRTNVTVQNIKIKTFQNGIVISDYSSSISISGNTITNTNNGLWVRYSSNSSISGNNIANNSYGIRFEYSYSNSLSGNTITNDRGVYFYNSSSNGISGNTITNTYYGIQLESYSNFNTISENNIIANTNSGIVLSGSSNNNTIGGNNIANNGEGISLTYSSVSSNRIYHNNFIDNTQQVYSLGIGNSWDDGYPSGGNYWSDYTGVDANGDGIGDTPSTINTNNQDRYPLIFPLVWDYSNPIPVLWAGTIYPVGLSSNSTISGFRFNQLQKQISFNLTGSSGATGYCNVTIPKALLADSQWTITINGVPKTDYTKTENVTHTILYFTYTHASTSHVIIQGTSVIPEFLQFIILPLFMVLTLLAVVLAKSLLKKTKT
jgi:parallel beta-helix repeat protein